MNRVACAASCFWKALWAPWDGGERGGSYGWNLAPRPSLTFNILTLYALPFLFGFIGGSIGAALGGFAFSAGMVEAAAQFFVKEPYKVPISRMLVDWIPDEV